MKGRKGHRTCSYLLLIALWNGAYCSQAFSTENTECSRGSQETCNARRKFQAVKGLFIQEDASKALPLPGQHPDFGAKISWPQIRELLTPNRKLLLLVRHGEAVSNAVQAAVGELAWSSVATACHWYNDSSGENLRLYDPNLTARGEEQAKRLRAILDQGSVSVRDLVGKEAFGTVFSPLTRTVQTLLLALGEFVDVSTALTDEYCRERFGHNTCDARSRAFTSGPEDSAKAAGDDIPCSGLPPLSQRFPQLPFHIAKDDEELGLVENGDPWWRPRERESDTEIQQRAERFLDHCFSNIKESTVFVVTHSGMISALLSAMGREGYSASNAELVPALVEVSGSTALDEL